MGRRMFFEASRWRRIDVGEVALRVRHGGDGPPVAAAARPPAHARHLAPRRRRCWPTATPSSAPTCAATGSPPSRPTTPDHAPSPSARWRRDVRRADARARARALRRGRPRPRRARRASHRARPSRRVAALLAVDRRRPDRRGASSAATPASPRAGGTGSSSARPTSRPSASSRPTPTPGTGRRPRAMGAEAYADCRGRDPRSRRPCTRMCEDYRAGLGDRPRSTTRPTAPPAGASRCPLLVLWSDPRRHGAALRRPARDLARLGGRPARRAIDSGHHMAEEAPEATAAALAGFWTEVGWTAP